MDKSVSGGGGGFESGYRNAPDQGPGGDGGSWNSFLS